MVKLKQPKKQFSTLVKNTKKAQKISYADMAQSVERRLGKEMLAEKMHKIN